MGKRIETERLVLRPWRESDAEALFEYAKELLGKILVTHQTGPEGKEIKRLYIEKGSA